MSLVEQVGVLILTYNEAPNIERTLSKLGWAKRILIVDSGSTDETIQIARRHPQVEVIHRPFDDFASQCNFGLSRIDTNWVLSLDADYELSDDLVDGVGQRSLLMIRWRVSSALHLLSLWSVASRHALPAAHRAVSKRRGQYRNEGHGHRVTIDGLVRSLTGPIYHDDRKPLSRWLFSPKREYARIEADHLLASSTEQIFDGLTACDSWHGRLRSSSSSIPFW